MLHIQIIYPCLLTYDLLIYCILFDHDNIYHTPNPYTFVHWNMIYWYNIYRLIMIMYTIHSYIYTFDYWYIVFRLITMIYDIYPIAHFCLSINCMSINHNNAYHISNHCLLIISIWFIDICIVNIMYITWSTIYIC